MLIFFSKPEPDLVIWHVAGISRIRPTEFQERLVQSVNRLFVKIEVEVPYRDHGVLSFAKLHLILVSN